MSWPDPRPGLVIRYSYLWRREHDAGRDEGVKDRPCAIVVTLAEADDDTMVYVLPITHSAPVDPTTAVEIPGATKARLGLNDARSWIVVTEVNRFVWPGPDLRFAPGGGLETAAYGLLPPALFNAVKARFLAHVRAQRAGVVRRTE